MLNKKPFSNKATFHQSILFFIFFDTIRVSEDNLAITFNYLNKLAS